MVASTLTGKALSPMTSRKSGDMIGESQREKMDETKIKIENSAWPGL